MRINFFIYYTITGYFIIYIYKTYIGFIILLGRISEPNINYKDGTKELISCILYFLLNPYPNYLYLLIFFISFYV